MIIVIALTALTTALFFIIFSDRVDRLNLVVMEQFSSWTTSPRWFAAWIVILLIWIFYYILGAEVLQWYTFDPNMIPLTVLFSALPFFVENSLKHSTAKQQRIMAEQLSSIQDIARDIAHAVKLAAERDEELAADTEATYELVDYIVTRLEGEEVEPIDADSE